MEMYNFALLLRVRNKDKGKKTDMNETVCKYAREDRCSICSIHG